jgi:proton-dependent oligopeptide transporter, POT family
MPAGSIDDIWIGAKHDPALTLPQNPNNAEFRKASVSELPPVVEGKPTLSQEMLGDDEDLPTEEEMKTLHRVADHIPWRLYTVAFVELCERFSYYGTQILFQNFVQRNLLTSTGAAPNPGGEIDNNPGALGKGQQTATGLGTFFSFWCYVTPLFGAYIADTVSPQHVPTRQL